MPLRQPSWWRQRRLDSMTPEPRRARAGTTVDSWLPCSRCGRGNADVVRSWWWERRESANGGDAVRRRDLRPRKVGSMRTESASNMWVAKLTCRSPRRAPEHGSSEVARCHQHCRRGTGPGCGRRGDSAAAEVAETTVRDMRSPICKLRPQSGAALAAPGSGPLAVLVGVRSAPGRVFALRRDRGAGALGRARIALYAGV